MKIEKTKNYDMFKNHENNREIKGSNLKKLRNSITFNNLLEFRPILVDGDMNIIDGAHRWTIAKELGIDLYYQINKEATHFDILKLNVNQAPWTREDFCSYYESQGNENYIKIRDFSMLNNMSLSQCIKLLEREGGHVSSKFNNGLFQFPDKNTIFEFNDRLEKCKKVIYVIKKYSLGNDNFQDAHRLRLAILAFLRSPDVCLETLEKKIQMKCEAIRRCVSIDAYYQMIKGIYNFRNPNPIE